MKHTQRFGMAASAAIMLLIGASCEQGSIFSDISNETKKASADVKGTPTRVVEFGGSLYVANGYLYERGLPGDWAKVSTPSGDRVRDIDTDGAWFYALTVKDDDQVSNSSTETRVYRTSDPSGGVWERLYLADDVSAYKYLYKLSAAGGVLFVGGRANVESAAYDVEFAVLRAVGTALEGAVTDLDYLGEFAGASNDGTNTYLATSGAGIFSSADSFAAALGGTADSGYALKGIYSTSAGSTIALGWNGDVLAKVAPGDAFTASTESYKFTGAIAEYKSDLADANGSLLLVGIKSGTIYGYREIDLSSGALSSASPAAGKPNDADSSVTDSAQYAGSLGVVSVEHLYQDWSSGESIVYASAYNEGLWSSTARGDWNLDH
jgi:hypothetical protein